MSLKDGIESIETEIRALKTVQKHLDDNFTRACEIISKAKGRVVTIGIGKAGYIAMKVSSTLASIGTPSFYLHPSEAFHGDLGRLTKDDLILCFSYSGETDDIVKLITYLNKLHMKTISITSTKTSSLAKYSDIVIETGKIEEACHLKLAPTSSTTAMLAVGDALAVAVSKMKSFTPEDFANFHPGGSLGKRFLQVQDVMRKPSHIPAVTPDTKVRTVLEQIIRKKTGSAIVVDTNNKLLGIFTDGDLRRYSVQYSDLMTRCIKDVMTPTPLTAKPELYLYEAAHLFKNKKVDEIPVVTDDKTFIGLIDIQDLISAGLI
ncbi:MAG: KpsF/GutQ family sugar-phosphate isomerase [Planctomycetes bacterium]|nr:KpsF/GutQ family sugar-phosphate isomerase [Planctomycetota bacterium]